MLNKYAFIDRDGTMIYEPPDTKQIDSLDKLKILDNVLTGLKQLITNNYKLIMISNQDGLGTTSFPRADFDLVQNRLLDKLKKEKIKFYRIFICPHLPNDNCSCRKPKIGLIKEFLLAKPMNIERSFMIGDRDSDKQFAENLGIKFYQAKTNSSFPRLTQLERITTETKITVQINLDGQDNYDIQTGIKFFDHMLEQIAKNSLIDLTIKCIGDLPVDEHHTVEDVGLVLGTIINKALTDKKGINRYGFLLPMDEALAEVAIDLSGRPFLVWNAKFKREKIGDMPTELFEDFFRAFANSLQATIHINLRYGRNEHHMAEAIFKCFGRALRQAVEIDPRIKNQIPSTKGNL
ncbi:MAG: bifunctional histidinol-phosphatase/imidazoleglycerol-phosphate dehydratase HisB [Candidatus Magasanikiibacteriota bacterium]